MVEIPCSPRIIPMVAGSNVSQLKENMVALSLTLSIEQLERLNQSMVQPNKYS